MPPQSSKWDQFATDAAPTASKWDKFAAPTPTVEQSGPTAPGQFQTMKGAPVQNANTLGSQPLSYANPAAAVSGAQARAALPQFGQQVQQSKENASQMAPQVGAAIGSVGGPVGMGVGAGLAKGAVGMEPPSGAAPEPGKVAQHAVMTGLETAAAGKAGDLMLEGIAKVPGWAKSTIKSTISKLSGAEDLVSEAVGQQTSRQAENLATFRSEAADAIRNNNEQALQAARKEALQRGAEELQPRLQQHVQEVHDRALTDLTARWDKVRSAVGDTIQANPNAIATGIQKSTKIVSPANKDLFDKVIADSFGDTNPSKMNWGDTQAIYTKLGQRLAKGGLPGDVYRSLKVFQTDLASEMESMANAGGVKDEFLGVKKDWSRFMEDFKDTRTPVTKGGSPIAHSLQNPDPGTAVKHFEGDAGDRAVQTLAKNKKYGARPELAKKYRDVVEEAGSAPKGGKVKDMPKLKQEPPVDTEAIRKEATGKTKRAIGYGAAGAAGAGSIYKLLEFLSPLTGGQGNGPRP